MNLYYIPKGTTIIVNNKNSWHTEQINDSLCLIEKDLFTRDRKNTEFMYKGIHIHVNNKDIRIFK